jgi:hypothetical protein
MRSTMTRRRHCPASPAWCNAIVPRSQAMVGVKTKYGGRGTCDQVAAHFSMLLTISVAVTVTSTPSPVASTDRRFLYFFSSAGENPENRHQMPAVDRATIALQDALSASTRHRVGGMVIQPIATPETASYTHPCEPSRFIRGKELPEPLFEEGI